MNKSDVIDRVSGAAGVGKQQAERVLDAFFETVSSAAKKGDRVAWPGFGAFSVTNRKARTGRNPRTGAAVKIAASKALKFSPSSTLKSFLNGKSPAKAAGKKSAPAAKAAGSKTAKKATKAAKATKASKR